MPDDGPEYIKRYGGVALSGQRVHFEARALRRWYSVEVMRVGAPEGRLLGVLFVDITEHKRMERRLAESEVRFNILADGLPMPVWVFDAQGGMRFVNTAYGEFFRCRFEQWHGSRVEYGAASGGCADIRVQVECGAEDAECASCVGTGTSL